MHPEKAERRRQGGGHRREVITRVAPREQMHGRGAQDIGQDPDDVVCEYGVARRPVHREREQADAEQVLAVGERVRQRIQLVRVEEPRHVIEHHVVVPRQHPDEGARVPPVARASRLREIEDRREHHPARGEVHRAESKEAGGRPQARSGHVGEGRRHRRRHSVARSTFSASRRRGSARAPVDADRRPRPRRAEQRSRQTTAARD